MCSKFFYGNNIAAFSISELSINSKFNQTKSISVYLAIKSNSKIMAKLLFVTLSFSFILLSSAAPLEDVDGILLLSQFKSFFQFVMGDVDGAKKTQENFLKEAPFVSQVNSAIQAATGNLKGAKETQEQFLGKYSIGMLHFHTQTTRHCFIHPTF